jgi:hypothetical protein
MKKLLKSIAAGGAIIALSLISVATQPGCATNTGTNGVVTINPVVFNAECAAITGTVAIGLPLLTQYDPKIVPDLHIAYEALNGIVNGASTNSASQIIGLIGKTGTNAAVASQITSLTASLSNWEQAEIKKYGATATGTVVLGEAQAAIVAWPPADQ